MRSFPLFLGLAGLGAAYGLSRLRFSFTSEKTSEPVKPGVSFVKPSTIKPGPPVQSSENILVTNPDDAEFHDLGRPILMPDGQRWCALPLIDTKTGLFARMTWEGEGVAFERLGLRRARPDEWKAAVTWRESIVLKPCTLVHTASDQARMRSVEYAERFDECFLAELAPYEFKGERLVIGSKWWSPTSRGYNFGFYDPVARKFIQPDAGFHAVEWNRYTDYSQLSQGILL